MSSVVLNPLRILSDIWRHRHPLAQHGHVFDEALLGRLIQVTVFEYSVLPLLHKPQYANEALAYISTSQALGIDFQSPAVMKCMQEPAELTEEIITARDEVARMKATASWIITKPLQAARNVLGSALHAPAKPGRSQ